MKTSIPKTISQALRAYLSPGMRLSVKPNLSMYHHRLYHSGPSTQHKIFALMPKKQSLFNLTNFSNKIGIFDLKPIVVYSKAYSTNTKPATDSNRSGRVKSLTESSGEQGAVKLTTAEKVKETAKTGGYSLVILAGVAIAGGLFWVIFKEFFSSESPSNIYSEAFKLCKSNPDVQNLLGTPIKCYGEESRRGWRKNITRVEFLRNNVQFMRMRFFLEGPFLKGTVNLEKRKDANNKYEWSYIVVDVHDGRKTKVNVLFNDLEIY